MRKSDAEIIGIGIALTKNCDSAKTMRLIKDIVEAPVYPAGE